MASVKLNAVMRNHILNAALAMAMVEDEATLKQLSDQGAQLGLEISEMVYDAIYSKAERKVLQLAPKGWFKEVKNILVRIGPRDEQIEFSTPMRVPLKHGDPYGRVFAAVLESEHPLAMKVQMRTAVREEHGELFNNVAMARKELRLKIEPVLGSVTTVAKLLEIWPEARELLPEGWETSKGGVPAIVVEELNKAVGLPTAS